MTCGRKWKKVDIIAEKRGTMFCSRERSESVERGCSLLHFCRGSSSSSSSSSLIRHNRHNRDRSSSRRLCRSLSRREQSSLSLHFRGREVPPTRGGTREESNVLEEEPAIVEESVAADVAPQQSRVSAAHTWCLQHSQHQPSVQLFTSSVSLLQVEQSRTREWCGREWRVASATWPRSRVCRARRSTWRTPRSPRAARAASLASAASGRASRTDRRGTRPPGCTALLKSTFERTRAGTRPSCPGLSDWRRRESVSRGRRAPPSLCSPARCDERGQIS